MADIERQIPGGRLYQRQGAAPVVSKHGKLGLLDGSLNCGSAPYNRLFPMR